jgi:heptosyltransferase-2
MKGRILVIRGGAIGDFVLTLPVFAALRDAFPEAVLEVLGYPHIASLALEGGLVSAVKPIDARPLAGFFAAGGTLDTSLGSYFASCHVIFSYLFDPDAVFQINVARVSRAQFIQGPHRPDDAAHLHASDQLLKPLERLAIFNAPAEPRIRGRLQLPPVNLPGVAPRAIPSNGAKRWLAIHPGSGGERKNWPEEKWAELLDWVIGETEHQVLLVGGEAEGERLARLAARLPADRHQVMQSQPLAAVARRLGECDVFLGHDSGLTHLAAAVGLAGIAMWADANEAVWRPRSERFVVLRHDRGLRQLPARVVAARLRDLMTATESGR